MNKHNPRNMEGFLKRVESAFGILLDRQFCYRTNPNLTDEQRKLEEPSLLETKAFVVGKCKNYLVEWQNWENKNNKGS